MHRSHRDHAAIPERRPITEQMLRRDLAKIGVEPGTTLVDDLDTHFPVIGAQYLSARRATEGRIGEAESVFFQMRDLVDFARDYFERVL